MCNFIEILENRSKSNRWSAKYFHKYNEEGWHVNINFAFEVIVISMGARKSNKIILWMTKYGHHSLSCKDKFLSPILYSSMSWL